MIFDFLHICHELIDSFFQSSDAVVLAAIQQLGTFFEETIAERTLTLVELLDLVRVLEGIVAHLAFDFHRA